MELNNNPVVNAQMLIRKPVAEVFEAFIDPGITSRFWFTNGSGRLEPGARIQWDWEMYGASAQVNVKHVDPNKRICIDWGSPDEGFTTVEWMFFPQADGTTFVRVTNSGFSGNGDEIVSQAIDSMGGFTMVLAAAKAFLEHGIQLNLVADHAPAGVELSDC